MGVDYEIWLNLIIRWAHIVVGIGWIGASFYFVALDFSLRKPEEEKTGVRGEAWQVHGGGFYNVTKYMVAPENLPSGLIWYKWDAYLTWITGFMLLVVQYYLKADVYLIDPDKMDMFNHVAIAISIGSLVAGWLIYDFICRVTHKSGQVLTASLVFILILVAAWFFSTVFSGRGALIHVGAFIGTIMAVNVFGVIIPNQRKIVDSLIAGEEPDPRLGEIGKKRSLHNNYLTLPVLLMMVSNHYPILASHEHTWLVIAFILIAGASVRHVINRHEAGDHFKQFWWALPAAAAALLAMIIMTAPPAAKAHNADNADNGGVELPLVSVSEMQGIVQTHCGVCHAPIEGQEEYFVPPMGIRLQTVQDIKRNGAVVKAQAVVTTAMPLGNATGMTKEERELLGRWIDQQ